MIAAEDRMRAGRKIGEKRTSIGVNAGSEISPMGSRHRGTAIAILAAHRLHFATAGAVVVHRLPHTAGMGRRSRDRHGRGDKRAREQEHKQQSGGKAMHNGQLAAPRIGYGASARKGLKLRKYPGARSLTGCKSVAPGIAGKETAI